MVVIESFCNLKLFNDFIIFFLLFEMTAIHIVLLQPFVMRPPFSQLFQVRLNYYFSFNVADVHWPEFVDDLEVLQSQIDNFLNLSLFEVVLDLNNVLMDLVFKHCSEVDDDIED